MQNRGQLPYWLDPALDGPPPDLNHWTLPIESAHYADVPYPEDPSAYHFLSHSGVPSYQDQHYSYPSGVTPQFYPPQAGYNTPNGPFPYEGRTPPPHLHQPPPPPSHHSGRQLQPKPSDHPRDDASAFKAARRKTFRDGEVAASRVPQDPFSRSQVHPNHFSRQDLRPEFEVPGTAAFQAARVDHPEGRAKWQFVPYEGKKAGEELDLGDYERLKRQLDAGRVEDGHSRLRWE